MRRLSVGVVVPNAADVPASFAFGPVVAAPNVAVAPDSAEPAAGAVVPNVVAAEPESHHWPAVAGQPDAVHFAFDAPAVVDHVQLDSVDFALLLDLDVLAHSRS